VCNTVENMRNLTLLILILFSINSYCQKSIGITENKISKTFYENLDSISARYNLKDLRDSDKLAVRIWSHNEIILLEENSEYTSYTDNGENVILEKRNFDKNTNLNSIFLLFKTTNDLNTKNDQYPIDAFPITIELNNSKSYELISFYKNDKLEEIIQTIRKENSIDELRKQIINNLPTGGYLIGMTKVKVDHFPKEKKSDFYKQIFQEIKTKLSIDEKTDPRELPLILINNKPHYFESLNQLSKANVLNYEIINDNRKLIYGTGGKFGVITIVTK